MIFGVLFGHVPPRMSGRCLMRFLISHIDFLNRLQNLVDFCVVLFSIPFDLWSFQASMLFNVPADTQYESSYNLDPYSSTASLANANMFSSVPSLANSQASSFAYDGILGRHSESCVHRVVRQIIGIVNMILQSNISYKRDGVDSFGQIQPCFVLFYFSLLYYIIWWLGPCCLLSEKLRAEGSNHPKNTDTIYLLYNPNFFSIIWSWLRVEVHLNTTHHLHLLV